MIGNIIVGFLTGVFSSLLVSIIFMIISERNDFERQKQELSVFLRHLSDELTLAEDSFDLAKTIWLLACKPYDNELIKKGNQEMLNEIDLLLEEVYEFCFGYHGLIFDTNDKNKIIGFEKQSIKYSHEVLKMKWSLRRNKNV